MHLHIYADTLCYIFIYGNNFDFNRYNLVTQSWIPKFNAELAKRYGHTMVCNGVSVFTSGKWS